MPEVDLIALFVAPLARARIRYVITGSVAATLYGEPRVTHDIDLVARIAPADVDLVVAAFPQEEFYVPPADVLLVEIRREGRGHFNLIHFESGLKADIYLASGDPLHQWAFENRREYSVDESAVSLAPPEYVIIRKLEYYREGGSAKHLRDIRAMLAVSHESIDRIELQRWIRQRGLLEVWAEVESD